MSKQSYDGVFSSISKDQPPPSQAPALLVSSNFNAIASRLHQLEHSHQAMQGKVEKVLLTVEGSLSTFKSEQLESSSKLFENIRRVESLRLEIESTQMKENATQEFKIAKIESELASRINGLEDSLGELKKKSASHGEESLQKYIKEVQKKVEHSKISQEEISKMIKDET